MMAGASLLGGIAKKSAADKSAATEEDNANAARIQGYFQERGMRLEQGALLSKIRNQAGAMGVDVNEGSPLKAYLQAARETELDVLIARQNTERTGEVYKSRADSLRSAGDQALLGSILEGAGGMMSYQSKKNAASFKG